MCTVNWSVSGWSQHAQNRSMLLYCHAMFFSLHWTFVTLLSIFILLFLCKDGDVDLNASPQALDRLLGCFLAFKVKVQPRFRNSVVLKYSDESDLINVVLDMIPDSEVVFCQIYFSYCECMHIFHLFFNCRFICHVAMLQDREFNTWVDRSYRAWICKLILSFSVFLGVCCNDGNKI